MNKHLTKLAIERLKAAKAYWESVPDSNKAPRSKWPTHMELSRCGPQALSNRAGCLLDVLLTWPQFHDWLKAEGYSLPTDNYNNMNCTVTRDDDSIPDDMANLLVGYIMPDFGYSWKVFSHSDRDEAIKIFSRRETTFIDEAIATREASSDH